MLQFQRSFTGQTFCIRVMFNGFMVDASNIFSFSGAKDMSVSKVKYSVEWWVFKPKNNGKQVVLDRKLLKQSIYYIQQDIEFPNS